MKVAVTSRSFSKNTYLKEKLLEKFPDSYFNESGTVFSNEELIDFLKPADAAIIALEKINNQILEALPKLKIISKYGVGLDNINFSALKDSAIKWSYTPGTNKRGVAELALQMMLILIRQSYQSHMLLKDGSWSPQFGKNLSEKKVGILGMGHVGKELVKLLSPFECKISCSEIKPDLLWLKSQNIELVSLEKLFAENDIVSIHIPLELQNKMLINEKILNLMPAHSILINTSRGGIVDEECLLEKLIQRKIQSAGFDVFLDEPFKNKNLLDLPHFYSTPHIGGSSIESIEAMGMAAINGLSEAKLLE